MRDTLQLAAMKQVVADNASTFEWRKMLVHGEVAA